MAVKYRATYKDAFDQECRIEITPAIGYSGDTINVRAVADAACIISKDASDDPYEPVIYTKAAIQLIQDDRYPIDIKELQQSSDRDFIVEFYIAGKLEFKGYIVPDGIQRTKQATPFDLSINAVCGLSLLDGIDYIHNNLTGGRNTINYLRQILFSPANLGIDIPLRWACNLTNPAFPGEPDALSGSVQWAPRGEGFTDYNGNYKTCEYILENMMRANQCRISQSGGMWKVERINAISTGVYQYREISGLNDYVINLFPATSFLKDIAGIRLGKDYHFVDEDAIVTTLPGLKSVKTTYAQNQRENIIPNGNMDIVNTIFNSPLYWSSNGATIESIPSLSDAKGSAVEVTNYSIDQGYLRASRLPENVSENNPLKRFEMNFFFKGTVKTGDRIFLSDKDADTGEEVNTYSYTVPSTFNNDTLGALQNFGATVPGFLFPVSVDYEPTTQEYRFYWIGNTNRIASQQRITTVTQTNFSFSGFLPIDTDVLYASMNFGFKFNIVNGYSFNVEKGVIDWENTPNTIRVTYNRGATLLYLNEFGYWVPEITDIQIEVNQLRPNDIASVDFSNKQGIKGVTMPLPSQFPLDRTNPPSIKLQFNIPSGRRVQFDDVYMNVEQNSDVYRGTIDGSRNTKKEEYTLGISSAHSGFYVSNYMTSYENSGEEKFFSDDKFTGTLTEMNTHAILRNRYKPSDVFQGSIYGKSYNYSEIYNIEGEQGKKFLPLRSTWNPEINTIQLTCVEVRDDNINPTMEHYGSEEQTSESN